MHTHQDRPRPQPAGPAKASVLVVDDEYGARLQVELALMGSETVEIVGEATHGAQGAEMAERLRPDIVILDLSMPGMDGFEALPLIRTLSPASRVLVRSSREADENEERAMRLGAAGFVPKFMAPDDLRRVVEHVAESAHNTRQVIEALLRAAQPAPRAHRPRFERTRPAATRG
jgi:DNA-binding NarL/FixJ family response regulator